MKRTPWYLWSTVVAVSIVGIGLVPAVYRPSARFPKDYTLPHDNFDATTMQQIQSDLQQYQVQLTPQNHEVYMVTGGIGTANPRIMGWDSGGDMTFGLNNPPGTIYQIQELEQNPMTWKQVIAHGKLNPKTKTGVTFTYKPLHWVKMTTKTGQFYYKLKNTGEAAQYFFRKGNTYIVVIPFPQDTFPQGLMSHLVPFGNPVKK